MERIIQGDCLDVLKDLPDNSVDAVVTDPPYGLSKEPNIREVLEKWLAGEDYHHRGGGFMGKTWDSFVPGPSIWREVFRVLKPGGHALVFAGTRTQDLMAISLRLAGFEIRDCISYLFFSGFPKSFDVSKGFDKRAGAEREVIGYRKQQGNGGSPRASKHYLDMGDGKTIDGRNTFYAQRYLEKGVFPVTVPATELARKWDGWGSALKPAHEPILLCRKPLEGSICDNIEKYGTGGLNIDGCRVSGEDISTSWNQRNVSRGGSFILHGFNTIDELREAAERGEKCPDGRDAKETYKRVLRTMNEQYKPNEKGRFPANCITTEPDMFYSKYFNITPPELSKKASKKDRLSTWDGGQVDANKHPTVKPTDLMAWLCRLITPPGGVVLDPFAGSGSTLVAAKREGFGFIGIEKEPEYVEIAKARIGVKEETAERAAVFV